MAEKLSVQIALEGGAEIERQLADIGKAGQQAFSAIGKSAEQVGGFKNLKPDEVTNKLKELGITGVESINKIQAAVRSAGRLEGLVQGIETAQAAFAGLARAAGVVGVAVAAGMVVLAKQTIGFAQALNKASAEAIKLGLSFQTFDQLRLQMEKLGMSAPAVSSGITKLKENLDKLEVTKLQKIVDALKEAATRGIRFAPGAAPPGLQQLLDAAKKIGPAGDFAREALRKFNIEILKTSNIRFAPGVAPTLEQLKTDIDPVAAGMRQLGVTAGTVGEQYTQITQKLSAMTDVAERNRLALLLLGEAAGAAFIQSLPGTDAQETAANRLTESINRLEAAWARFGSLTLAPTLTTSIDTVTAAIQALQNLITNFSWETFKNAGKAAFDLFTNAISAFTLQGMLSWIARAVAAWTGLLNLIGKAVAAAQQMQAPDAPLPEPGGIPMARGGLLGGSGTGTSDSNLAWLSRGEYVTPAHAVRQPGVLALLEALRRSGGNLSRVLDGMGHFAMGGLVPRAIPAFASGGLAGGGSHVTIQFPGLPPISGLRASSAVVEELRQAAALAQVRSGGRKPSRYS